MEFELAFILRKGRDDEAVLEEKRSPAVEASSWPSDRRERRAAEDEEVAVR